jgi:hypothetical protein
MRDVSEKAQREGEGINPTHTQPGDRRRWVVSTTIRLLKPQERPGGELDDTENLAPPRFNSRTVQHVVSCCTDYAIVAIPRFGTQFNCSQ